MPTHPTEITPPHTASSDPADPGPASTSASQGANPPDLRARRGNKSAENRGIALPGDDSPSVPLTAAVSAPPTLAGRPTLPPHINPDSLLFQYAAATDPEQLAARHNIDPETLFAWADHPHTQRLLERLRAFNEQRAPHIRAHAACAATAALAEIVRAPLYLSGAEISLPALRSQEITLRAALAILNPIERAATAKRTLNLRRAIAALNPRKNQAPPQSQVAQASRLCAPPSGPQPTRMAQTSHLYTAQSVAQPTRTAQASHLYTAPGGAGLPPAGSALPQHNTTPPRTPNTQSIKSIGSIPSIKSTTPTPAQNLRHRAGALPRAP